MLLSKKTEYAVRILTYMASQNKPLYSAKFLHEQLKIPYKYLTRLMTDMVKYGFLQSIQGREGGFKFVNNTAEITLENIIEAVEGHISFDSCILGFDDCKDDNPCALHMVWENNKDNFVKTLKTTTLEEVIKNNITKF